MKKIQDKDKMPGRKTGKEQKRKETKEGRKGKQTGTIDETKTGNYKKGGKEI